MEQSQVISPKKSAINYGLIFGMILILEVVIAYVVNIDASTNPSYGVILNLFNLLILPVTFISLGCKDFKKSNGGFLSMGTAIKIGLIICLIAALLSSIFQSIFYLIFPEYVDDILRQTRSAMINSSPDMPAEALETAMSFTKNFMKPSIMIPVAAATYCILGLIYSAIIGAIMKKEKPQSF